MTLKISQLAVLAFSTLAWISSAQALEVGDKAPNFMLEATDGQTYELSQFEGDKTVVLAWYPKAFTSGCTIECKSLAENGHLIKRYDARYFMISVDPIETNIAFAAEHGADFPLLSDPTTQTASDYGVLNTRGVANRHTFYIGEDGTILKIDTGINPATSAEDMASTLGELNVELIPM
jgi:thioredoxin-dependent peroxiredoxin